MNAAAFIDTEEEEEIPDPWQLDTTPERHGFTLFEVCETYIPYLFYGADSAGDMTEEEIELCDEFTRKWYVASTAEYISGAPYVDAFNTAPDLCLHGLACRTEGVWCKRISY